MDLDDLEGRTGDAVRLLGIQRGPGGIADLSALRWHESPIVLRGLTFTRVGLRGTRVRPNLVECRIVESEFRDLESVHHFWGAENQWLSCRFVDVALTGAVSPQSVFDRCTFERVRLEGYRPCQTTFSECGFVRTEFVGMRGEVPQRPSGADASVEGRAALFRSCAFRESRFAGCSLAGIAFCGSTFTSTEAVSCDFEGVESDVKWWGPASAGDPFVAFLDEVEAMVRRRLGADSIASSKIAAYARSYRTGATTSRDYTACLFEGDVPYDDLRKIEGPLEEIEWRYAL